MCTGTTSAALVDERLWFLVLKFGSFVERLSSHATDAADAANGGLRVLYSCFPMPPSTFYGVSQVIPFGGPELISCGINAQLGLPT
ncbi:hypothetical protein BDZ89DRAFT_409175 [Hymenopellis radicata]|nr:hypothetical protein BDZ89DRAFT_409175 [Hymenopellis radicata]